MVVSVILCISLMRTRIFLPRWRVKMHNEERKRRTLMDIFCVSLIVFSLLSAWIDGPGLAPSTSFLSLGLWLIYLVGRPTRRLERRSQLGYLFLRLPPYRLPQVARVLQARTSAPCKTVIAIEPSPPGFQSPCLHPLHPFKLRRRSSSAMTVLSCFTISWISPKPAHAFINSPFIQSSELS